MFMMITIAIPHYKNFEGIKETVFACLNQEGVDSHTLELIIVNDGNESFIKKYNFFINNKFNSKVRILNQHQRKGAAAARNKALQFAKGEIILFLDSDCVPRKDWAEQMVKIFKDNPSIKVVGGKVIPIPVGRGIVNQYYNITNRLRTPIIKNDSVIAIITANCGFKTDILKAVSGFNDEIFNIRNGIPAGGEDIELSMRLIEKGYILHYNPEAIVYHKFPTNFGSVWGKYRTYGKAMRLICELKQIDPVSIGQPAYNIIGKINYCIKSIKNAKLDFFKFYVQNRNVLKSFIFAFLELIRKSAHLYGYSTATLKLKHSRKMGNLV